MYINIFTLPKYNNNNSFTNLIKSVCYQKLITNTGNLMIVFSRLVSSYALYKYLMMTLRN